MLWNTWFARLGLGGRRRLALGVATIGAAVAAALDGASVALARSLLLHDAHRDGHLARVIGAGWDMPSSKVQLLRWPGSLVGDGSSEA